MLVPVLTACGQNLVAFRLGRAEMFYGAHEYCLHNLLIGLRKVLTADRMFGNWTHCNSR